MESDFVVVLPKPGGVAVIAVECKTTLDATQFKKAVRQFDSLKHVLENELGLGRDTEFVRCLAYLKTGDGQAGAETCQTCSPYLIKFDAGFLSKFAAIMPEAAKDDSEKFKCVVRDLLTLTSPKTGSKSRVADAYATRHSQFLNTPAEAVFFWSPEQYGVLNQKFAIFQSGTVMDSILELDS